MEGEFRFWYAIKYYLRVLVQTSFKINVTIWQLRYHVCIANGNETKIYITNVITGYSSLERFNKVWFTTSPILFLHLNFTMVWKSLIKFIITLNTSNITELTCTNISIPLETRIALTHRASTNFQATRVWTTRWKASSDDGWNVKTTILLEISNFDLRISKGVQILQQEKLKIFEILAKFRRIFFEAKFLSWKH